MFHGLDLMRVNAYIAFNAMVVQEQWMEQKEFILEMVKSLLDRATTFNYGITRVAQQKSRARRVPRKRKRMSHKKPKLPAKRFEGPREEDVETIADKMSSCKYCSYVK